MSGAVLDSSAVLAILKGEAGGDALDAKLLAKARISTVNLAEVQAVLVRDGMNAKDAWEDARSAVGAVEPFTSAQARVAGNLLPLTRARGLSLGACACLALAITAGTPLYTADRAWSELEVGCRIHVIR